MSYKAKKFIKRVDINSKQVRAIQLKSLDAEEVASICNKLLTSNHHNHKLIWNGDGYVILCNIYCFGVDITDWLVATNEGLKLYPIKDQKFKQLYSLIADDLYSRNIEVVEAIRLNWLNRFDIKNFCLDDLFYGVYEGDPYKRHKHKKSHLNSSFMEVASEKAIEDPYYECYLKSNNYERIAIGNWVIKRPNGQLFTLSDKQFNLQYKEYES